MKCRDYIILIAAVGCGIASVATVRMLGPLSAFFPLLHALGSKTGGTLVWIAGFGLSLSWLNQYFATRS